MSNISCSIYQDLLRWVINQYKNYTPIDLKEIKDSDGFVVDLEFYNSGEKRTLFNKVKDFLDCNFDGWFQYNEFGDCYPVTYRIILDEHIKYKVLGSSYKDSDKERISDSIIKIFEELDFPLKRVK